jgi:proliferating cell nuclear antigen
MTLFATKNFQTFLKAISTVQSKCRLHIDETGIKTQVFDSGNVAMVRIFFPIKDMTRNLIGFDVAKIEGMFRNETEETLDIEIEELNAKAYLNIQVGKSTIKIQTLQEHTIRKDVPPPDLNLPFQVSIPGNELSNAIKRCYYSSEWCKFIIRNGKFQVATKGDTDEIRTFLSDVSYSENISSVLSLDYLKDMMKTMQEADLVTINMTNDHPVQFAFKLGEIEITYLLAPRIDEDNTEQRDL